jgi:hypothetical protein
MPNGEQWDVPAEIIIMHRAKTIAEEESKKDEEIYSKIYDEEYKNASNDNDIIIEWARDKFTWADVEARAFKAAPPPPLTRAKKEEAWKTGTMVVLSKVAL